MCLFFRKSISFRKKKQKQQEKISKEDFTCDYLNREDFYMEVEDVFTIIGRGTVITGKIQAGLCEICQEIIIQTRNGNIETSIIQIEQYRKLKTKAYKGEYVGLLLKNVSREQIQKGDRVSTNYFR